ncbi:MAG TPA: alpha/beta fold hydrolase [Pseudolysinimonas sp.]|jgi:3-oxoadipate enol-lactonase
MILPLRADEPAGPPSAPLLVLGPSLGTSTELWDEAAAFLPKFRLLRWDLPGHGRSAPASSAFSVADLADAVLALVDSLGEASVGYAGVSLGGAVGLELALRHPDRVRALSVVCSGARISTPDAWTARAAVVRSEGTASLIDASAGRWFAPGALERIPDITSRLLATLAEVDDESYARCCEALADYDVAALLPEIERPVQAVWAEFDRVAPRASAEEVAIGVRSGRSARVAAASHLAVAERPDAVASLIDAFVTEAVAA